MRFPAAGAEPLKVDVFRRVGSARLVVRKGCSAYCLPLEGAPGLRLGLRVREAPQAVGAAEEPQEGAPALEADSETRL